MRTPTRIAPLLLVVLSRLSMLAEAQPFQRVCAISPLAPVFTVTFNEESGDYEYVSVDLTDPSNRNLNATTSDDVLMVRECPCARDIMCYVDLDTCGVPVDLTGPVGCFAKSTKKTLLRNAWPLLLLWYSTILFFLICTEKGRNARNFVLLKCCKSNNNERLVDRFLYTHGLTSTNPFAQDSPSQHPLDWLPIARPVEPREPTELVLKTRIFEAPAEDADVEEEDNTCTICFAALEDGDRVGKLSCDHTFHVDCLREWLPRRNVCPLCQTSNAATPRYADGDDGHPTNDENNNDNSPTSDEEEQATAVGQLEMAPVETSVVEVEDPQATQSRRSNPSFAQQLVAAARIGGRG